jgi:hypothetical protein
MKKMIAAAVIAASAVLAGQARATTPAVARSCTVVFRAMSTLSSYDILNPKAQARSRVYEKRAAEVAVKGGLIPSTTTPLPKATADQGSALVRRFNSGDVSDVQLAAALSACQKDFGYAPLP